MPPPDYEFVMARPHEGAILSRSLNSKSAFHMRQLMGEVLPMGLVRSLLQRFSKPPTETVFTYAFDHIVLRPEPWIVEIQYASLLLGFGLQHFARFRRVLEKSLASKNCKKIICWSEAARRTVVEGLSSERFRQKVELIYYAVTPKSFVKTYDSNKIKLLHVGSLTSRGTFDWKGGRELLEAFRILRSRYPKLELVMRAELPADVKAKSSTMEGLRIIDGIVSWEMLETEFKTADICIQLSHETTPQTILDAMSFELPVVSRNTWANPEYVTDGESGMLVQRSRKMPYYYRDTCHPNFDSPAFRKFITRVDPAVVEDTVRKLNILIEDHELRRRLGKRARWEVEHGKFTLEKRNNALKRVFDEVCCSLGHNI